MTENKDNHDKEPSEKIDEKKEAKNKLENKMKNLNIVGVVYNEKTKVYIGITENGTPKIINQDDALIIGDHLKNIGCTRNSYALGDENKEADNSSDVDAVKVREANDVAEDKEKAQTGNQRSEEAKSRLEEAKREPDGFEMAYNRFFGRSPESTKKEVYRGIISDDLKTMSNTVASRALQNMAKTVSNGVQKVVARKEKAMGI